MANVVLIIRCFFNIHKIMIHELLTSNGFKICSIGNYIRNNERVFLNISLDGHSWFYKDIDSEPIQIKSESHFLSLIKK